MGVLKIDNHSCLVTELCQYGTLTHVLRTNTLEERDRIEICLQIARVCYFLHQGPLKTYHRDLKCDNILVSAQWIVKLADFR